MKREISFLIIVPTYNSYNDLQRLCDSLLKQTYQNWRTIFVDADSSIHHKKWLNSIAKKDKRFLVKDELKNSKGIYPSMSFGFTFAKKDDWVIFLGSDDWFNFNGSLETIADKINFSKNQISTNIVIYQSQYLNKYKNKLIRLNKVPRLKSADNLIFSKLVFYGYVPPHQSVCFSTKILKKIMPYSKNYFLAADCDLFMKFTKITDLRILFIKKTLVNIQSGGISSNLLFRRLKEVFIIYIRHFKLFFIIPLILRYFKKILSNFFRGFYTNLSTKN